MHLFYNFSHLNHINNILLTKFQNTVLSYGPSQQKKQKILFLNQFCKHVWWPTLSQNRNKVIKWWTWIRSYKLNCLQLDFFVSVLLFFKLASQNYGLTVLLITLISVHIIHKDKHLLSLPFIVLIKHFWPRVQKGLLTHKVAARSCEPTAIPFKYIFSFLWHLKSANNHHQWL